MTTRPNNAGAETGTFLFGAGFVFGVMATLLILAVMLVGVTRGNLAVRGVGGSPILATVAGSVVFAAIVGASLYYLAFPENRTPVEFDGMFGSEDE